MANRQYIGARYVPKLMGNWDINASYEAFSIVQYLNTSYTSKKPVPAGTQISNTEYWVATSIYNAQVEEYRQEVEGYKQDVENLETTVNGQIENLQTTVNGQIENLQTTVNVQIENLQTTVNGQIKNLETTVNGQIENLTTNVNNTIDEIEKQIEGAVNVRAFGAVGDANYYDNSTMRYYKNAEHTLEPTSDVTAVNNAIAYAIENNLHTIYFPKGEYYLPNWSYTLDISKLNFVGDGNASLISTGLGDKSTFITLVSPLDLGMYDNARTPIRSIAIKGAYFNGIKSASVNGIKFDVDTKIVPCHSSFENVVIMRFANGISAGQIYKTTFINCTIIACEHGYHLDAKAAIPVYIIGGFIECCDYGIVDLAATWGNLVVVGCALEYNRSAIYCPSDGRDIFIGCRIEGDPLSAINYPIQGNNCCFTDCDFLFINNYVDNVRYWINNPSQFIKEEYSSLIYSNLGEMRFENCLIGVDNGIKQASGNYKIATIANGLHIVNCKWNGDSTNIADPQYYATIKTTF